MKKIIIIVAALLMAAPIFSQSTNGQFKDTLTGNVKDTLTNAGTKYLWTPLLPAKYAVVGISLTSVNKTGTTAYTATIQHSINGVDWYTIPTDSVIVVSGATTSGWHIINWDAKRMRIKAAGTGTQSTELHADYYFKQ